MTHNSDIAMSKEADITVSSKAGTVYRGYPGYNGVRRSRWELCQVKLAQQKYLLLKQNEVYCVK